MLFTVGHSNHELADFLRLLTSHGVTALADVRSQPGGRLAHFHKAPLTDALRDADILYVFLGDDLGARRSEPSCYVAGRVDYRRVAEQPSFQRGLARVRTGLEQYRVCLMCAEKEPLDCHRTILVCRHLRDLPIQHILANGELEDHATTERRLLAVTDVRPTLFEPSFAEADLLERAYDQRGQEIAYQPEPRE